MEERVALSLSFTSFLHSIFPFIGKGKSNSILPFIKDKSTTPARHHVAVAAHTTTAQHPLAAGQARHSAVVAPRAAARYGLSVVGDPAPGSVPVYGPYLFRPTPGRHKPPLVTHPVL
jgi:hypothetical protein